MSLPSDLVLPGPDRLSRALVITTAVSLLLAVGLAITLGLGLFSHHPWNPLGAYPEQTITNGNRSIPLGHTVNVIAKKCAKSGTVRVQGQGAWVSVNRPEIFVQRAQGIPSERYKSCGPDATTPQFSFANNIPPEVAAYVRGGLIIWRIEGTETPVDDKGKVGVPRTWQTEAFTLTVPKPTAGP